MGSLDDITQIPNEKSRVIEEANYWAALLNDPDVTNEERVQFRNWLEQSPFHADCFDKAVSITAALSMLNKNDLTAAQLTQKTDRTAKQKQGYHLFNIKNPRLILSAAASVVLVLAISLWLTNVNEPIEAGITPSTYMTEIGQNKTVTLSDGSQVVLGPKSHLVANFKPDNRQVTLLDGVAYFNVVKDSHRPFTVESGDMNVMVVGTEFGVKNNGHFYRVGVAEGHVKVKYPIFVDGKKQRIYTDISLYPGQEVSADMTTGLQNVQSRAVSEIAAWKNNQLIYHGAPLGEVVADFNRLSSIPIEIVEADGEISALQITGAYIGRDVDNLLIYLNEIHNLTVDKNQTNRIIISKPAI